MTEEKITMKKLANGQRYKFERGSTYYFIKVLDTLNDTIIALFIERDMKLAQVSYITEEEAQEFFPYMSTPPIEEIQKLIDMESKLTFDGLYSFRIE